MLHVTMSVDENSNTNSKPYSYESPDESGRNEEEMPNCYGVREHDDGWFNAESSDGNKLGCNLIMHYTMANFQFQKTST